MKSFVNQRLHTDGLSTIGELTLAGADLCEILEPGFETPVHPCIPAGTYPLELRAAGGKFAQFKEVFGDLIAPGLPHILVPGRDWVLVHPGNTVADTEACALPGLSAVQPLHAASGHWEVSRSRDAFRQIYPVIRDAVQQGGATWTVQSIGATS